MWTLVADVVGQQCTYVSNGQIAFVRYWDANGDLWVFGGPISTRLQVMREVGKEAANLESSFSWNDAANVNEAIREHWPEQVEEVKQWCDCHACRERRDRDSEAKALAEMPMPKQPRWDWLVIVFFAIVLWRSRVKKWVRGIGRFFRWFFRGK